MKSLKCPQCGLVNFASAPECKRCRYEFQPKPTNFMTAPVEQFAPAHASGQWTRERPFTPLPEFEPVAAPIGGWLIVFAIYLIIIMGLSLLGILYLKDIMGTREFYLMTTPGSPVYIDSLNSGAIFEFIRICFLGIGSFLLILRFLRKSSSLPGFATTYLALFIASGIIDFFMAVQLENKMIEKFGRLLREANIKEIIPAHAYIIAFASLLIAAMWLIYVRTSRRVESTFVN